MPLLWPLQVDKSTDISGKAQLLAFIRFTKDEKCVIEYLFCRELQTTTKGEDIFNVVNENILLFELQRKNCVSVCTDGFPPVSATSLYVYIDPLIMCRVSAFRLPDTVLGVVSDYVISLLVAIQLL